MGHPFQQQVANRLKAVRTARGLSLDKTAKATGVSKAMLGQIERGESSPTIATLWKIATGLECSYSSFFNEDAERLPHTASFPEDPQMQVDTLFPYASDSGLEMFAITLLNQHCQMSEAHQHGVIEHVVVLSGELELLFDGHWHRLSAGESSRFSADQPHGYRALTDECRFHNIVSYPRQD